MNCKQLVIVGRQKTKNGGGLPFSNQQKLQGRKKNLKGLGAPGALRGLDKSSIWPALTNMRFNPGRVQTLQGQQFGRIAVFNEHIGQAQL